MSTFEARQNPYLQGKEEERGGKLEKGVKYKLGLLHPPFDFAKLVAKVPLTLSVLLSLY